jgi:hypothetical protein
MVFAPQRRARLQATLAWIGTLFIWWKFHGLSPAIVATLTGSLALLAWLSPAHYAPVQHTFDRLLHAGLTALTWVILAVLYLMLFTPIRFWRALTGNDPLHRQPDPDAATYLQTLPPAAPKRFERQF